MIGSQLQGAETSSPEYGGVARWWRSPWRVALVLTLAAAIPRVIRPGLSEFKLDESVAVLSALEALHRHVIPLQGQSSSVAGAAQGPLLYDLIAGVLAAWPDPRLVVVTIGLLNAVGVGLTYVLSAPRFGRRVAVYAAILFASGAWAIVFSRKIWPNDLLAPAAVVALWGLLRAGDPNTKTPGLGRTWVALAALVSLNFGAWPEVIVPIAAMTALPRTRQGRAGLWTLAGIGVFVLSLIPRVPDVVAIAASLFARAAKSSRLDFSPFGFILQLAGTDAFRLLGGPDAPFVAGAGPAALVDSVLRALLVFGAIVALARWALAARARGQILPAEGIILLWWLAPAVASVDHGQIQVFVHHYLGTYPTQFILIALAIETIGRASRAALVRLRPKADLVLAMPSALATAVVGGIAAVQLAVFFSFLQFIAVHPSGTFFGIPLDVSMEAAKQAVLDRSQGPVVVLSNGDQVGVDPDPTVWAALTDSADLIYVNANHTLVIPSGPSSTLFVSPDVRTDTLARLAHWQESSGPLVDAGSIGGPAAFERLTGHTADGWRPAEWIDLTGQLDDGAAYLGASIPRQTDSGQPLDVQVAWVVGRPPTRPSEQSVFAHLVGDDGRQLADQDFSPLPIHPWHAGDLVIDRFSLAVPDRASPGRYWIDVGRYQRPGLEPVRIIPTDRGPGPSSLRIGPVAIPPPPATTSGFAVANVAFGNQIRLAGWQTQVLPGRLRVKLLWQPETEVADRYTVFVHLLDLNGRIVAQNDGEPDNGRFPTSTWERNEDVVDPHHLSLAGVPIGRYRVEVGLYLASTGRRLGVGAADSATIATVDVGLAG